MEFRLNLSYFNAIFALFVSILEVKSHAVPDEPKSGRLKAFDDIIEIYISEMDVIGEINISHILDIVRQTRARFISGSNEDLRCADYYVQLFEYIQEEKGLHVLQKERNRLDGIIESSWEWEDVEDAQAFKTIVEAFYDYAAKAVLRLGDGSMDSGFEQVEVIRPGKKPEKMKRPKKVIKQPKQEEVYAAPQDIHTEL